MAHGISASTPTPTTETGSPDLGYHWIWTYGHLLPAFVFAATTVALILLGFPWWAWLVPAVLAAWGVAGFLVMRFGVRMNEIAAFPAADFLADGSGKVLDVGCGSGRLSIALGRARPRLTFTGLDNFSADYIHGHGAENTERNFRLAGIADRATIRPGDMREMPFEPGSFQGAMSSAAIDHLEAEGIRKTLREIHRVVEPGGQFLLLVIVPNIWLRIAFGPLVGRMRPRSFWQNELTAAGFDIQRQGTVRTTALFLSRNDEPQAKE